MPYQRVQRSRIHSIPTQSSVIVCFPESNKRERRLLLSPERATLSQLCLTPRRLAKDRAAARALDDGRSVGEDGGDLETTWALDVHEERPRSLDQLLELVLARFGGGRGVEEIDGENHIVSLVLLRSSLVFSSERVC